MRNEILNIAAALHFVILSMDEEQPELSEQRRALTVIEDSLKQLAKRSGSVETETAAYSASEQIDETPLISEFVNQFFCFKETEIKQSSLCVMRGRYKNYILPYFGDLKVNSINCAMVEKWYIDLPENLSVRYKNSLLSNLRCMFDYAIKHDIIDKNPTRTLNPTRAFVKNRAVEGIHRALTFNETNIFMKAAKTHSYYELFAFLLSTGCRIGEAGALTWGDVDFKGRSIRINKTIIISGNEGATVGVGETTKSIAGIRIIPMSDSLYKVMSEYKNSMAQKGRVSRSQLVFTPIKGKYITGTTANTAIRTILGGINKNRKRNKIHSFTSHAFRDTFATRFIEKGGSPKVLQEILGHGSFQMTMDLYAHNMENTKRREMKRYGNMLD